MFPPPLRLKHHDAACLRSIEIDLPIDDHDVDLNKPPPPELVDVTVPFDAAPGSEFLVELADGARFFVATPEGCVPGDMITIEVPPMTEADENEPPTGAQTPLGAHYASGIAWTPPLAALVAFGSTVNRGSTNRRWLCLLRRRSWVATLSGRFSRWSVATATAHDAAWRTTTSLATRTRCCCRMGGESTLSRMAPCVRFDVARSLQGRPSTWRKVEGSMGAWMPSMTRAQLTRYDSPTAAVASMLRRTS